MVEHGISARLTDMQSFHVLDVPTYEGFRLHFVLKPWDLKLLREDFCILDSAFLEILAHGCVDKAGFSGKSALAVSALTPWAEGFPLHLHYDPHGS